MIEDLLARARRRAILASLLAEMCLVAAVVLGCLVLLLILRSDLGVYIALVWVGAAALAIASFRVLRKLPSSSSVARIIDLRCGLHDALATAVWCRGSGHELEGPQRKQAEAVASGVDLARVIPFAAPKTIWAVAGLAVIALALLPVRFGEQRTLALTKPAAPGAIGSSPTPRNAGQNPVARPKPPQTPPAGSPEEIARLDAEGVASGKTEGSPQGSSQLANAPEGAKLSPRDPAKAGKGGDPKNGDQRSGNAPNDDNATSLMSKLRDAVSSLMGKNKPPEGNRQPGGQKTSDQQKANNSGQQQPGAKSEGGQPQPGDESDTPGQDEPSPGSGMDRASAQNASPKPGSGMGRQDGKKELADAAQLAAMGKISEIIGKRSAQVSGEMTIDPQSGPQQLKTGYTRSNARHGQWSGDVSRDEVPIELQPYVQRYFEQVHKQAAAKARRAPSGASAP